MNTTNLSCPENNTITGLCLTPARWPGAVMILYSLICTVAYTLCLATILTNKDTAKLPSYQIIVHIGISDIGQLLLNGIVGGVFSLCQTDFNFYLNKTIGGITNSIWVVCVTLADLLAWNRLCHTYSPSLAQRIFAMKNTRRMLAACWVYGLAWVIAFMFPNLDPLYDPAEHNWNYGPHPSSQIFANCELAQDILHCASMAVCYVAIVFKLVRAVSLFSYNVILFGHIRSIFFRHTRTAALLSTEITKKGWSCSSPCGYAWSQPLRSYCSFSIPPSYQTIGPCFSPLWCGCPWPEATLLFT